MSQEQLTSRHVPSFKRADTGFELAQSEGIEHLIDETTNCHYLSITEDVVYPEANGSITLSEVLLEKTPQFDHEDVNRHYLLLPDNYATMTQALNDALGQTATPTSEEVAHDLFAELGYVLSRVAQSDGLVPTALDYRRVLFLRDVIGVKLLPPLRFESFADKPTARHKIIEGLWQTCLMGASSVPQVKQLPEAFKGFEEGFNW